MSEFETQQKEEKEQKEEQTLLTLNQNEKNEKNENEEKTARHGVGDRKVYYSKWDNFAKKTEAEIEEEEKEAKEKEEKRVAQIPKSEADKRDREKREALKEAKQQWDGVKANENLQKIVISNESNLQDKIFHFENDLQSRRVIVLKDNTDCNYTFPSDMSLIKVFVEECKRCTLTFNCNIATSTVEFSRCEDLKVNVQTHPIHTIQIDLSERVKISYANGFFSADSRVYHSAVRSIRIEYKTIDINTGAPDLKYQELDDFELSEQCANLLKSEELGTNNNFQSSYTHQFGTAHLQSNQKQFVTTYLNNDLVTDLVLRDAGGHITTIREIEERKRAVEKAVQEKGLDPNSEVVQKLLHEYDPPSPKEQALKNKEKGNGFFKECDYVQATLFYTQSIEILENLVTESNLLLKDSVTEQNQQQYDEYKELLCTTYSNRAACALKLGDHQQALNDTNACLVLDPENVKANFRKGLALHALGRYREACPIFGLALKKEPNNKQIKEALLFAERKASLPNSR